jgi:hypothetical protein
MLVKTRAPRIHFGLNRAGMNLPGGFRTLIHLAWISDNPKAREVARRWNALSPADKREVILEDLCDEVRIMLGDFAAAVAGTGAELGINVSALMDPRPNDIERLSARAMMRGGRAFEQFLEAEKVYRPRWSMFGGDWVDSESPLS